MSLAELKHLVVEANKELPRRKLVKYSWGNVSAIDRKSGIIVIKPVGLPYNELTVENVSVVDLEGKTLEGPFNPSVDLPIHLALYKAFECANAIAHTHSTYATMWAQAGRGLPCFGTTHADYFYGEIPCTRKMADAEINAEYETETGNVIVERFQGINPADTPGVLTASHGPFTWGKDVWDAVHKSVVLEEIAKMALGTKLINPDVVQVSQALMDKHFFRKHGPGAYFVNDDHGAGMVKNV
jgi:L-ribulose-5-phosphate 4-epimerase